jgi:cytoskeleton protein RodZ
MSESAPGSQPADRLPSAIADPVGGLLMGSADAPLVLNLEALELTWVLVQADDGSPQEALLRPGERVQWKGTDRFTVTLGNAGGVRVELNGKVQGPFGPTGKVIRDIVLKRS